MKRLLIPFLLVFITFLCLFFIKGQKGNPIYFQTEKDIRLGGPFELSNGASRYALTEAIVENRTFFLDDKLAKFGSPDVVDYKGKFFSIFTPGISFIGVPFYILGKQFGFQQLFAYFSVTLFAILNVYLVAKLAWKFGVSFYAGIISGLVFLFGTNALVYAFNFTQHHVSTTLILLALINAFGKRNLIANIVFGVLVGVAALVDIPNFIMLAPIALYIFYKNISFSSLAGKLTLRVKLGILGLLVGLMPLFAVLLFYNQATAGSYFKLAQNIGRTHFFRESLPPRDAADLNLNEDQTVVEQKEPKLISLPFNTRNLSNGFYVLFLSNERSWLFYSPVLLVGFWGLWFIYKKGENNDLLAIAVSVVALNFITYSMFADVWGGWAFGSRYLIPAAAVTIVGVGVVLDRFRKNKLIIIAISILIAYGVYVNLSGALTTSAVPPRVEAKNLTYRIPYTYKYNFQLIEQNFSGSLIYNMFFRNLISYKIYYLALNIVIFALVLTAILGFYHFREDRN